MATANLTDSPTVLDTAAAAAVWVRNTGLTRVTFVNGLDRSTIRPGRDVNVVPRGQVTVWVQPVDGPSGSISYDMSAVNPGVDTVWTTELAPGLVIDGGTP